MTNSITLIIAAAEKRARGLQANVHALATGAEQYREGQSILDAIAEVKTTLAEIEAARAQNDIYGDQKIVFAVDRLLPEEAEEA